jgi:hypothetical protein
MTDLASRNTLARLTRPDADDPLFDEKQAADYIDVQPGTLANWRSTGRYSLAFVRVGRKIRYRKSALDFFMAARTVNPAAIEN